MFPPIIFESHYLVIGANPLQSQARVQIEVDTEGVPIFTSSAVVVAVLESLNTAVLKFCDDTLYQRLEKSEAL